MDRPTVQHIHADGAVASVRQDAEGRDGSSGSVATPIDQTYSVHHLVGGDVRGTGSTVCQFIADPKLPGEPDDTVVYDGIAEATRTDIFGTVPKVTESKTDNGDGSHLLVIETFTDDGADLFPSGLSDETSGAPLTDACFFIGLAPPPLGDPLNWSGVDTVTAATISYLRDGAVEAGPIDVTSYFSDPWNGVFGHTLAGGADLGINGVQLEIRVGKAPQGPLGACCQAGECIGDLIEDSCLFQGGTWTGGASCGADPSLPAPVCQQSPCGFNNGTWLDDSGAPISQYAPDQQFARAAADDFTLAAGADEPCWINNVRVWMAHTISGTDPELDYQGVNVTVYANGNPDGPNGEPQDDGSHFALLPRGILYTQKVPMSRIQATPLASACVPDVWQLDIPIDVVLNRGVKYWLEVQPIMDSTLGNTRWLYSQNNTENVAKRFGDTVSAWIDVIGNGDACPGIDPPTPDAETRRNLAFELTGESAVAPLNDDCLGAVTAGDGIVAVNNIGATTDGADEGDICDEGGTGLTDIISDVWYEYVATCTGTLHVNMCRSEISLDSRIAIYDDCGRCPPENAAIACNDDGCTGRLTSDLSAAVVEGSCYRIRVGGYPSPAGEGKGIMEIECVPPPPPTGACCNRGQGACADGVEEGNCTGVDEEWTQDVACADLDPPCIIPPPENDECENAIEVFTDEPYIGSNVNATGSFNLRCETGVTNDFLDVWHVWTADCDGAAVISLCGSNYDTTLTVFDACGGNQLACNDDRRGVCPNSFHSEVSPEEQIVGVSVGQPIYIRVSGYGQATGQYMLHVKPCQSACCTTSGDICLHRYPEDCSMVGGIPHPGLICTGDADGDGVLDVCAAVGACCDRGTGVCTDDVMQVDCTGNRLSWVSEQSCSEIACEPAVGACCDPNPGAEGACHDSLLSACLTPHHTWIGDETCATAGCEEAPNDWAFYDAQVEASGGLMPDFDQNKDYDNADQDGDPATGVDAFYGGPTAVADSLEWLHQKFPDVGVVDDGMTKIGLIEDLATRMGTNGTPEHSSPNGHVGPYAGTFPDDLQSGLDAYLARQGVSSALGVVTEPEPSYAFVRDEVLQDHNVTLQLGFYHIESVDPIGEPPTGYVVTWRRTGAHYVGVAGVEPVLEKIALSDPDADFAEENGAGFVRGPDHDHDGDGSAETTSPFRCGCYAHVRHNNEELVSHDVYDVHPAFDGPTSQSVIPGGAWLLAAEGDPLAYAGAMVPFHQEGAGGAFDVADATFLDVIFLEENGYPTPAVCQTYTVVEAAVVLSALPDRACCGANGLCAVTAPTTCIGQGGVPLSAEAVCLGDNDASGVDDACTGCLPVALAEALPSNGTLDARQPYPPDDDQTRQGIGSSAEPIFVVLSPPLDGAEACFDVCETDVDPKQGPNSVTATYLGNGEYEIALHHAITAGAFTAVQYTGSGDYVGYMLHPANVDADGGAGVLDVGALIDCCLLGNCEPAWGMYSCDLDHSGLVGPADLLRAADLLNGAALFDTWDDTARPANSSCP